MKPTTTCPGAADLRRFLLGQAGEEESASMEEHVLHCATCLRAVQALPADDLLLVALRQGRTLDTPSPADGLLERLQLRLLDTSPSLHAQDTTAGESVGVPRPPPAPSAFEGTRELRLLLAPPQRPDEIGRLGGYRILKELGRGGMGVVYKAEDTKLKRTVAVKAMLPALAARPDAARRFLREAETTAAVEHDHIVRIYQVDEDRGVPFLAMEFLQGESLEERLKREGKLPVAECLRVGREVAEGLAAAHARGLVHRDVKPANVWLEGERGRVKILDFGLARAAAPDSALTQEGAIIGTPAYMASEQAKGQTLDGRCDLFSLGVLLYRLCTGRMPFAGGDAMSLLLNVTTQQPAPPIALEPNLPPALSELIVKLLEKDPARRPAGGRDVALALLALERELAREKEANERTEAMPPSAARPAAAPPRRRRLMLAVAAVLLPAGLIAAGAAVLVHISTDQGDYVIRTDDPDFTFQVHDGAVTLQNLKNDKKYILKVVRADRAAGEFELEATDGDLSFRTKQFTIKRGEKAALTAWFEPKQIAANPSAAPPDDAWVKEVAALPADKQVEAVAAELKRRNHGFDGKMTPTIEFGVVTGLQFLTDDVTDISPVRALPGLRSLICAGSDPSKGRLADLSPLKGMKLIDLDFSATPVSDLSPLVSMPLTYLSCRDTRVSDLSPLKGMKLTNLVCGGTKVTDLSPLEGMPLTRLICYFTGVSDLSPLKGMKLTELYCNNTAVSDLSSLTGTPLTGMLQCDHTGISDLSPLKGMSLTGLNCGFTAVSDLSPLKEMRLTDLRCPGTAVSDLSPLKGMQLTYLEFHNTRVSDLSPLKGMPLKALTCDYQPRRDAEVLRSLKALEKINGTPAADFWKDATVAGAKPPLDDAWVKEVAGLFPKQQVDAVVAELKKRNPQFDGQVSYETRDGVVVELRLGKGHVTDISPLRVLAGLRVFQCGVEGDPCPLADLSPLKAMKLEVVNIDFSQVSDLSPLAGMPLTELKCRGARVEDLSPLKGAPLAFVDLIRNGAVSDLTPLHEAPLTTLLISGTRVQDLSPLKGMALTHLEFEQTRVTDLTPLVGMPLTDLGCSATGLSDLTLLRGMKLTRLGFWKTSVSDLSPLKAMKLTALNCDHTKVSDLSPLKDMPLTDLNCADSPVSDLSPLKGMPLTHLNCTDTKVSDLAPLKGMPLTILRFANTGVFDLSPLKGVPLTYLNCSGAKVLDLSPLKGMPLKELRCDFKPERDAVILRSIPTLETINDKPAADFWKETGVAAKPPLDDAWVKQVAALPAEKQGEAVAAELKKRNPGFDGKVTPEISIKEVTGLQLLTDDLTDISPLRAIPTLEVLWCEGSSADKGRLSDLSPLKGMKLRSLSVNHNGALADLSPLKGVPLSKLECSDTKVADLSPLAGMPLTVLLCYATEVSDLSALKGMKLTLLNCSVSKVSDLSALAGMPLTELACERTRVADLSPLKDAKLTTLNCAYSNVSDLALLRDMPLTWLSCQGTRVSDLSPLKGMKLTTLDCSASKVSDLSPLKGMPLKELVCDFDPKRDAAILRSIPTLETINGKPAKEVLGGVP